MKHNHYFRDIPEGMKRIDIYRVLELFGVTCPVAQHVIKKAVAAGQRGHKDLKRDWDDIADSAVRRLEMMREDSGLLELHGVTDQGQAEAIGRLWADGEQRMEQIGRNSGDGLHYALEWQVNTGSIPILPERTKVEVEFVSGGKCLGQFESFMWDRGRQSSIARWRIAR